MAGHQQSDLLQANHAGKALIESVNGQLQDECMSVFQFASLTEAQLIIDAWRVNDQTRRLHRSLGHLISSEFVNQPRTEPKLEEALHSVKSYLGMGPTSASQDLASTPALTDQGTSAEFPG